MLKTIIGKLKKKKDNDMDASENQIKSLKRQVLAKMKREIDIDIDIDIVVGIMVEIVVRINKWAL